MPGSQIWKPFSFEASQRILLSPENRFLFAQSNWSMITER